MRCVLSVLGKDRTGIVAKMAAELDGCGANIDDINQTILGDIFSMTMIITLPQDERFNELQDKLAAAAQELGVQTVLQREDVFQYMYKI